MAIDMDAIKKLSPKAKAGIIVAIIVVIGYFDWFYFLSATVEKRTALNQKVTELQAQVKEKRCLYRTQTVSHSGMLWSNFISVLMLNILPAKTFGTFINLLMDGMYIILLI